MGQEQPPEFYDKRMDRLGKPLEESPWLPVYQTVVDFLPPPDDRVVLDIGCGTGRLAELMRRNGYEHYRGFDFSPVRVDEARRYVPGWRFDVLDATSPEALSLIGQHSVFVLTEFLEHVEADLKIIEAIPSGSFVAFSVPNYDSAGHVRFFNDLDRVVDRYGSLIDFDNGQTRIISKPTRPEKVIYVMSGRRR